MDKNTYTRCAMLVPFQEYQKKIASKKDNKTEDEKEDYLNPEDYKNDKPSSIIGEVYPDLYSQASYLNQDLERIKEKFIEYVNEFEFSVGCINVLYSILDEINDSIYYTLSKDNFDGEYLNLTKKGASDFSDKIGNMVELAKTMGKLHELEYTYRQLTKKISLTKSKILM